MDQVYTDQTLIASIRISYQPIIRLGDMRPDYVEVLARTATSNGELDGPESIVVAMTEAERSMRLTTSIMQRTLAEYQDFQFEDEQLCLAFNLPLDAMLHPDLIPRVEAIRTTSPLAPPHIRFELTERHPVHDLDGARRVITALRNAGYVLALDDVTETMPNLPALLAMPISAIKLDRSIVNSTIPTDQNFIRAMVAHAQTHNQDTIAEGIETPETLAAMTKLGITHGQGYLFARPLAASALQAFLRSQGAGK